MRVLVLTLSFGSGHVRAAEAVARELARQAPGADVRVVDALADSRALFRACYVWPYWVMVRRAPALWERFFNARVARMDEHTAPAWALRWGCPRVFKSIAEFEPDVIVAAEVAACELAVLARRAGLTAARGASLCRCCARVASFVVRAVARRRVVVLSFYGFPIYSGARTRWLRI